MFLDFMQFEFLELFMQRKYLFESLCLYLSHLDRPIYLAKHPTNEGNLKS